MCIQAIVGYHSKESINKGENLLLNTMTYSQSGEYVILRAPKGWGNSLIFHYRVCYLPNVFLPS